MSMPKEWMLTLLPQWLAWLKTRWSGCVSNKTIVSANLPFRALYPHKLLIINKIIGWHIASMEANVPAYLTF